MSVFGSGIRPWKRQTETKRAEDSSVPGKGELVVSDAGKVYAGDGATQAKNLSPMLRKTDADTTYATTSQGAKADSAVQPAGLTKTAVGLGNVDNTADTAKPISTATQTALDGKAATSHTHTASQVSDSTSVGRSVLTAADAAAARTAIGAGTGDVTASGTQTLTNKRITPRIGTTASSATPTIDTGATDQFTITALAAAITSWTILGTPTDGQRLLIRILDNGTARAITWPSSFRAVGVTLPKTTTASKTLYVGLVYNSAASYWDAIAVGVQA